GCSSSSPRESAAPENLSGDDAGQPDAPSNQAASDAGDAQPNQAAPDAGDAQLSNEAANTSEPDALEADGSDAPGDVEASEFQSCGGRGDCIIVGRGCCWAFPIVPESYAAIRADKVDAWRQAECPSGGSACDGSFIPNDRLLALCVDGACREVLVPSDP